MQKRHAVYVLALLVALVAVYRVVASARSASAPHGAMSTLADAAISPLDASSEPRARRPMALRSTGPVRSLSTAESAADSVAAAGAFEGRVLSALDGTPVPRASLVFVREGATRSVVSDDAGRFRFVPLEAGRYDLATAVADGYLPFSPEVGHSPLSFFARAQVTVREIVVSLVPRVEYVCRVLDERAQPVVGARVKVVHERAAGDDVEVLTDARGEARVAGEDGALVEARSVGFETGRSLLDLRAQVSHRVELVLRRLDAGDASSASVSGRVVDGAGQPISGALVTARVPTPPASEPRATPRASATSAADGRFLLVGLDRSFALYTIEAAALEMVRAAREGVAPGATDVVLVLRSGGCVRGLVAEQGTRRPVPGFTVALARHRGAVERSTERVASVFDAEGRFSLCGVEAGTYDVLIAAYGYATWAATAVRVSGEDASRASTAPIVAELSRGARVRGRVTDGRSRVPIEGARISLESSVGGAFSGSTTALALSVATSADRQGQFELRGLAPGVRSLFVAAFDHHSRVISGLVATEGAELGPLEIELSPVGRDEEPRIELVGIGAVLAARGDALVITRVIEGGGAAEAGLREGDEILSIDGASVGALGFEAAIARIRGAENSAVALGLRPRALRDGGATEAGVGATVELETFVTVVRRRLRA
ncbi:MAG: carboxypeptidase regulatory-like domain-containing protein [Myxococcales bacterium]|nr:carboxypeptidase regulatory-like domain-containing protein [Myxococcales bacterium]